MTKFTKALVAGAAGASTTTLLHEVTRRLDSDAPRIDLLGMQALAHLIQGAGRRPAPHGRLYTLTLVGNLASNSAYFGLVGASHRDNAVGMGSVLGILAGLGAVSLPPWLGRSAHLTQRTTMTMALTVALYTVGGITAGMTNHALPA